MNSLPGRSLYTQDMSGLPRRDVVGPVLLPRRAGNGGLQTVKALDYCTISQDAPTTVFNQPAIIGAYSKGDGGNDWLGISGTQRSLVMFDGPLSSAQPWKIYLGKGTGIYQKSLGVTATITQGGANASLARPPNPTHQIMGSLRVRPIIDDYDLSALTWNDFNSTPPTMAADIGSGGFVIAQTFMTTISDNDTRGLYGLGYYPFVDLGIQTDDTLGLVIDIGFNFVYFDYVGTPTFTLTNQYANWGVHAGPANPDNVSVIEAVQWHAL